MYKLLVLLMLSFLCASCAGNKPADLDASPIDYLPALAGDYFEFESEEVGRNYHIFVRLPEGYDAESAETYPVVYLLDGDSTFPMLAPTHLFLTFDENIPEAILVGIAYGGFGEVNKRHIDFTAQADGTKGEAGAVEFLSFLKTELIPNIESKYQANPDKRILLGQSRGGYFALWSALEDPDLFWARIASNPSLIPGKDLFFAEPTLQATKPSMVAVVSGTRDLDIRQANAREWTDYWSSNNSAPWEVKLFPIENGTHAASLGETYRQTLLWVFQMESESPLAE